MDILLDTTYFSSHRFSIRNIPRRAVITLIERGYKVLISEVSIFKLSVKGARYVADGRLSSERICKGIKAIYSLSLRLFLCIQKSSCSYLFISYYKFNLPSSSFKCCWVSSYPDSFEEVCYYVVD